MVDPTGTGADAASEADQVTPTLDSRTLTSLVLLTLGLGSVSAGAFLIGIPVGLLVVGGILLTLGILVGYRPNGRSS
jgi:hypothetical protein